MMMVLRMLAALGCVAAGIAASCSLYSAADGGRGTVLDFLPMLGVASLISFSSFAACRACLRSRLVQAVMGGLGSYVAMLVTLILYSMARGEMAETGMWMPIILLFGIPFLAPVVILSGLAAFLVWPGQES